MDNSNLHLPFYDEGPSVVLVLRESERALIFEHARNWIQNPMESKPMTLANCPDYGVVCKEARHRIHDQWAFKKLGIGPIEDTMHVHVKQKWIVRTVDDDWMDVSLGQYKEENSINMLHNIHGDHPTPGDQDFIVNNDGTISPTEAQWLCLGVEQPRMVLVTRSSPRVLHFSNKPEGIFELTLAGW